MKKRLLLLAILAGFLTSNIQAQDTVWFDANWQLTSQENASYYRPTPEKKNNGFWIIDYYKNGAKQMEGFSVNNIPLEEQFDGLVMYYHKNGNLFHKANYKAGKLHGERKVFFKTGELKEQGKYKNGKREGVWKTFYKNGKIEQKGKYKNGEKVGVWKTFYKNI